MSKINHFKYYKTSPEIIKLAIMYYVRYPLSLRNVEDILHERGIDTCHETIRYWWNNLGPRLSKELKKKRRHAPSKWRWHIDEVFIKINGKLHYLWRAIDHEGTVLDCYVTKRRDQGADLCAKHSKWMMFFSTSEVYGRTLSSYVGDDNYETQDYFELREDQTPMIMGPTQNQRWSYACAKQLSERYIYGLHSQYDMPFTIIRPLNFFGSRMDFLPGRDGEGIPRVLACFMQALMDNEPIQLVDGGHVYRTITAIEDAIDAIILMLNKPDKSQNEIFNIGHQGNEITIKELAHKMRNIYADLIGDETIRDHAIVDVSAAEFYGEGYEDSDRRYPNVSKAKDKLGWVAKTSLDNILKNTVRYFHEHYKKS